ncbi:NAD(P)H-binding protein [Allorhodopirellula heiligendammensis]|nr:NAD(P)H-binding protein [Allorhodopirellula heiligendammensis]
MDSIMFDERRHVLLTGATGHVGGALLPRLLEAGFYVRCMTRDRTKSEFREDERISVIEADVLQPDSLRRAMEGCDLAYYLVHSMSGDGDFAQRDRRAAGHFRDAAAEAGLDRLIYLGGLGREADGLSEHLRSRQEVGRILRQGRVPTIEFRAAMVIGAGSLSFEMVKNLCHRLPVMICPQWLSTQTQPIGTADLVRYLMAAADIELSASEIVEIGTPDTTTYREILAEYSQQNGLRRVFIPVPFLTPWLSGLWLSLVTPETARIGSDMVTGLANPTIVTDSSAERFQIDAMSVDAAIARALAGEAAGHAKA